MSYVYVMHALGTNMVKIGASVRPRARIVTLQSQHEQMAGTRLLTFSLIAIMPGYEEEEWDLREQFEEVEVDVLNTWSLPTCEWVWMARRQRIALMLAAPVALPPRRWLAGRCASCDSAFVKRRANGPISKYAACSQLCAARLCR